jgi:hypothetical protein
MNISIDEILSWKPCKGYNTRKNLKRFTAGKEEISLNEMLKLNIKTKDKIWILLHEKFFSINELIKMACIFARHVLKHFERVYPDDKRPRKAIKATYNNIASIDVVAYATAAASAFYAAISAASAVSSFDSYSASASAAASAASVVAYETDASHAAYVAYTTASNACYAAASYDVESEMQLNYIIKKLKRK